MELTQHPEYPAYVREKDAAQHCQQAITTWKASGELISVGRYGLEWTYDKAQEFMRSLSLMLQQYNRVIWESFPYCRQCYGQCCVTGGSYVGVVDYLALALLDNPLPALPQRIEITSRDCIYRTSQGCSWPAEWKTLKCWVFYCLGPVSGQHKTSNALLHLYRLITIELE